MSQIRVVTDSAAEIPAHLVAKLGITVVPMELCLEDHTWRDSVDITSLEFLERVTASASLPTMLAPSVEAFEKVYAEVSAETDEIISIHVSSKLSQTVQNARQAAGRFLGRSRISILDSELISGGLGLLVVAAAEAAANGSSMQQIVRLLRGMIPHIYVVFFIESLEYLERSQRIDRSQAILGNLLNIKPMLIIEDGELMPLEKVRTRDKAVERLHQFISEFSEFDKITISHGLNGQESPDLLERIAETFSDREISITTYGPSMTAQLGPRAIGVIVCEAR